MKIRPLRAVLICLLSLSFIVPARAWPPPCPDCLEGENCDEYVGDCVDWQDCGGWCCDCIDCFCEENYYDDWCSEEYGYGYCYECSDCYCVLKDWAECGQHSDCTGECHGGCYTCTCLDDSSKCNAANCEECNNGICEDRCVPLGEYCDGAGECVYCRNDSDCNEKLGGDCWSCSIYNDACYCMTRCGCGEGYIGGPGYGCNEECEECVNCKCQLKWWAECTSDLRCYESFDSCHVCNNCECWNTCNGAEECCDEEQLPSACVKRCVDNAATCEWEDPDVDLDCRNPDPTKSSCEEITLGQLCGHRIIFRVGTAKCGVCDPDCRKFIVDRCARLYPTRCENVPRGSYSFCECSDEGSPTYSGFAYDCF